MTPSIDDADATFFYDEPGSYTVSVANTGVDAITGPVSLSLNVGFAFGTTITDVAGAGWSCLPDFDPSFWDCEHPGPIAVGGSLPTVAVSIIVTESQSDDSISLTATTTADGSEPELDFESTPLGSRADLTIAASAVAPPWTVGESASATVTVQNLGAAITDDIVVSVTSPSGWTGTGPGWVCASGSFEELQCLRTGGAAPGPTTLPTITLSGTVPPIASDTVLLQAVVSSAPDKAISNNLAEVQVQATAPLDLAVIWGTAPDVAIVGQPTSVQLHVRSVGTAAFPDPVDVTISSGNVEGLSVDGAGWACALDFGDVLVHIFSIDQREFYRLEDLWAEAPTLLAIQ